MHGWKKSKQSRAKPATIRFALSSLVLATIVPAWLATIFFIIHSNEAQRTLLEQQICQQTPLAPSSIRPDADPYLARWAMRCLSRDPGKRPLAGELAGALARYRSGGPIRRFADATIEICRSLWRPAPRSNS